jgi:hypothetical protein
MRVSMRTFGISQLKLCSEWMLNVPDPSMFLQHQGQKSPPLEATPVKTTSELKEAQKLCIVTKHHSGTKSHWCYS